METEEQTKIKEKMAELRARYARLRNLCGPRHINRATAEEYAKQLQTLEAQLN